MYYHHRYQKDGNCEIICTRCFLTVGMARGLSAIKELETSHICAARASLNRDLGNPANNVIRMPGKPLPDFSQKLAGLPLPLLLAALPLVLYALPTALEVALSTQIGPWLASIVMGDLAACIFIFAVFKMRRTAVILYLLLTLSKIVLFQAHLLTTNGLPWITDVIPVLVVIGIIATMKIRPEPQAPSRP
jgi:hypothetical protein